MAYSVVGNTYERNQEVFCDGHEFKISLHLIKALITSIS